MTIVTQPAAAKESGRRSPVEVLLAFLKLGLTSFGGPVAHIGYFREEFVVRRRWLDEHAYADLVGLCQFLPGPASSQVGFSIGLMRAGYLGGLAAWTGFTLPSAIALVLFAYGATLLSGPVGVGLIHGLKLVAVAIVAQAVWGMARVLCPDRERASIAVAAALIILLFSTSPVAQIAAIALGGVAGLWLCRAELPPATGHIAVPVSRTTGFLALAVFFLLLAGLPVLRGLGLWPGAALFEAFYRSGALVFGGGHVVLPLLREAFVTPGWISDDAFLAGYGAAQAIPGPLFSFAAYLGAVVRPSPHGLFGRSTGLDRHLSSRLADPRGDVAVLGRVAKARERAGRHARRQRGGCRIARCGALQSGLDELGQVAGGFRDCARGVCHSHRLARTAHYCRPHRRARRHRPHVCPFGLSGLL